MFAQRLGTALTDSGLLTIISQEAEDVIVEHAQLMQQDDFEQYVEFTRAAYWQADAPTGSVEEYSLTPSSQVEKGLSDGGWQHMHQSKLQSLNPADWPAELRSVYEHAINDVFVFGPAAFYELPTDEHFLDVSGLQEQQPMHQHLDPDAFMLVACAARTRRPWHAKHNLVERAQNFGFTPYVIEEFDQQATYRQEVIDAYANDLEVFSKSYDPTIRSDLVAKAQEGGYLYPR